MGYLIFVVPLWLVYLALTANLELSNLVLGLLLAVGIVALLRPTSFRFSWRPLPGALMASVHYLVILIVDLIRSGIQVARIVLDPALPIRPGIVAIPSGCQSELATALSAHAITVTPGELVVEIDADGVMYTHALDATQAEIYVAAAQRLRRDLLQKIFA